MRRGSLGTGCHGDDVVLVVSMGSRVLGLLGWPISGVFSEFCTTVDDDFSLLSISTVRSIVGGAMGGVWSTSMICGGVGAESGEDCAT